MNGVKSGEIWETEEKERKEERKKKERKLPSTSWHAQSTESFFYLHRCSHYSDPQHHRHPGPPTYPFFFSSFPSPTGLRVGWGDVRRSEGLPTYYLLLSFPWSWSPAAATPPHPSRPENWGEGEASYVTACRRSRRRRGKDRERGISLTTQLRPQNRRLDTPILKNPQQWQPPRTAVSSSSLFLASSFAYTFIHCAQSLFSVP